MTFLWTTGVKELRQQIKNNAFTYLENIRQKKTIVVSRDKCGYINFLFVKRHAENTS